MTAKPVPEHISDERPKLTAYELQVLIGTTISGCNMSPDRTFDLPTAWARLKGLGLIDRADGIANATPAGVELVAYLLTELQHRREAEAGSYHRDDLAVDRFAAAMKAKLALKRAEGRGGWDRKDECSEHDLNVMLYEHLLKGDPVDVANFCMMLHQRDERIVGTWEPEPERKPPGVMHNARVIWASQRGERITK